MHANSNSANAVSVLTADLDEQHVPLLSQELHVTTFQKFVLADQTDVKFVAPTVKAQSPQTAWIIGDAEGLQASIASLVRKGIQVVKAWTLNDLRSSVLRRDVLNEMHSNPPVGFGLTSQMKFTNGQEKTANVCPLC